MRVAYRKTNGRASDVRFVTDDYQLLDGELELQAYELPSIDELSDPPTPDQVRTAEIAKIEAASGMDRGEREIAIKVLPPEAARRQRAEKAEAAIAALGVRKA